MYDSYLQHHGIKGMKWGVRRFRNEDGSLTEAGKKRYSDDQFARDASIYGRAGARRIQKRVEKKGASVSGARSDEAKRIHSARRRAVALGRVGGVTGHVVGALGGAAAGLYGTMLLRHLLETNAYESSVLDDPATAAAVSTAVATGATMIGATIGRYGGQAVGMISGGYSPNRYRYE